MAMLPMAVPGLVLGLAYIFFFNAKGNPLGFIYATMIILVVNSVTHFYTVSHLTATTSLKQLDPEFEAVSASLKASLLRTMARVTVPICLPVDSRHQHLPLRQCDDHRLRRDLPLFDGHQARGDLDHPHGRGRIHRRRGGDGGDHRGHLGRGEDHPCPADAPVRPHDAGLAQALSCRELLQFDECVVLAAPLCWASFPRRPDNCAPPAHRANKLQPLRAFLGLEATWCSRVLVAHTAGLLTSWRPTVRIASTRAKA